MKTRARIQGLVWGIILGLAAAGPAGAAEVWVAPTHYVAAGLPFPWPTTGSGFASFAFMAPDDFASLTSVKVVLVPKTSLTGSFDVYGSVKRDGEVAGERVLFNLAIPSTLAGGTVQEIDVTSLLAGQLDAGDAGHAYVSVFFWFPASPGLENATVLGLRFTYAAVHVQTADIENAAVTTPKLANGAVTTAKLADDSVGPAKIVTGGVGTDEILNGSVGAADINKTEVQTRVTGSCVPGRHMRSVTQAGDVVCEADAGLTSFIRAFGTETCIANQYCYRTVTCPNGRFVVAGGIRYLGFGGNQIALFESYPADDHSWRIGLHNENDDPEDIEVWVVCAAGAS